MSQREFSLPRFLAPSSNADHCLLISYWALVTNETKDSLSLIRTSLSYTKAAFAVSNFCILALSSFYSSSCCESFIFKT